MTLQQIQQTLKVPKNLYNSFGKYHYRNAEGILEAVKPLLDGSVLILTDEMVQVGERYYIKASVIFTEKVEGKLTAEYTAVGWAREVEDKKGMDGSQITGTASSYARKYALNGLFLIDDTKDADTDEYANKTAQKATQSYIEASDEPFKTDKNGNLINLDQDPI